MGNCRSFESKPIITAKLILLNGQLQEFSWPIKVSQLLQQNSNGFICSSDEMEFDEPLPEMGGDEVLQPGEVYFELPEQWRHHRLQAEDLAALAMKAGVAISSSNIDDEKIISCTCCWSRKIEPMILTFNEKERSFLTVDRDESVTRKCYRKYGAHVKGHKFVANLSVINED